jgi:hypothetical protein
MRITTKNLYVFEERGAMMTKGLRKNNLAELTLRFGSDLADPIEQNHRNS